MNWLWKIYLKEHFFLITQPLLKIILIINQNRTNLYSSEKYCKCIFSWMCFFKWIRHHKSFGVATWCFSSFLASIHHFLYWAPVKCWVVFSDAALVFSRAVEGKHRVLRAPDFPTSGILTWRMLENVVMDTKLKSHSFEDLTSSSSLCPSGPCILLTLDSYYLTSINTLKAIPYMIIFLQFNV